MRARTFLSPPIALIFATLLLTAAGVGLARLLGIAAADGTVRANESLAELSVKANSVPLSYYSMPGFVLSFGERSGYTRASNGCLYNGNTGGAPYIAVGELHLPDDAVIKQLRVYYVDNDATTDISARISIFEPGQSQFFVGTITSSGSTASVQYADSVEITHTVSNAAYAYAVEVLLGGSANSQICGVRVAYYTSLVLAATPTNTRAPPTDTPSATTTATITQTPTPTATSSATPTPFLLFLPIVMKPLLTPTPTTTSTPWPTSAATPTGTPTPTNTSTATPTRTSTATPTSYNVTWASKAPMLTPRSGLGLAATTDGKLYAIGGDNDTHDPVLDTLSSVEMYDPDTNTWTPRASMPTKRAWLAAVTASNGKIYAIGGAQCQNCPGLSTVEEYDPTANAWTTKASMPTARQGLAAVAAAGGNVYALGGYNGQQLPTVEEYDPEKNAWRSVQSMPTGREHLAAVLAPNGLVYAIGGGPSNVVEAYNPTSNTWARMANMPTSRWALGAALGPNGRIYAIGGNGPSSTVEEYDPVTNSWATRTGMPTPRQSPAVAAATNGRIYVVGGERSALQNLDTVEEATIR